MHKILWAIVALLFIQQVSFAAPSKKTTILGTISDGSKELLLIRNLTKPMADTLLIKDGKFTYVTELQEVTPFLLSDGAQRYQLFFAGPSDNVNITLNRKDMMVTFLGGSKSHETFRELIVAQEPLQKFASGLSQEYSKPNANMDSLNKIMNGVNGELRNNYYKFLDKNKNTEVAAFVVYSSITNDKNLTIQTADTMYGILGKEAVNSFYGQELNKMLAKLRAIEVGYMAPDFTLPDSSGKKKITLSSFRGKYVLIDFWASWCGPCKAEIPFLKQAYTKYQNKGFEIVSVSLDDKKPNWLAALNQYQMPWVHISDVKGFNSVVNELYHVPAIPKTLLLDKTGKIIAKDLRGPALDKKLDELLK
jgi:thiol-disulfide isomerase/thioredoxin